MEPVPYGTEERLAEYLHRQLLTLEKEISLLKALKKPLKITLPYQLKMSLVDADPGAGNFRIDNLNWALATNLYFDDLDSNAGDSITKLRTLKRNDKIFLQDRVTAGNTATYRVQNCTIATGYFKIAVLLVIATTGAKPVVDTNFNIRFTEY